MCGIGGIASTGQKVERQLLDRMGQALRHRGPDGQGIWLSGDDTLGLVHRRLAIIDLSHAADQPMATADGRFVITYNGEIYNYTELRDHLQKRGTQFRTSCDTEVLLYHLARYGEDGLKDLDGMFSFALWDEANKDLFCARDRFGEKPFFYYEGRDSVYFASEIKALIACGVPASLNPSLLYRFFSSRDDAFERAHPERTFYQSVKKLESAGTLRIREGRVVSSRRYWRLNSDQAPAPVSFKDAQVQFREIFFRSVRRRMRADVDIGSSLSGGLDSSSIVVAIDQLRDRSFGRQHTFSARFKDFHLDEGQYIESVGRKVPVDAHFTWPNPTEFLEELETVFHFQDEPFASSSIYAQFCVMRLAKESGVVVLLDGQGADEMLTGYHHYFADYFAELQRRDPVRYQAEQAAFRRRHSREPDVRSASVSTKREKFSLVLRELLRPAYRRSGVYRLRPERNLLARDFVFEATQDTSAESAVRPNPSLNDSLLDDLIDGKLELLLRYADRNSMAHSREVRLPFLSHELVEFVFSLPADYKIREGWSKYLLRCSMERFLPNDIAWRVDKIGFATPEHQWLTSPKFAELRDAGKSRLIKSGVVNPKWVDDGSKSWELAMAGLMPSTAL